MTQPIVMTFDKRVGARAVWTSAYEVNYSAHWFWSRIEKWMIRRLIRRKCLRTYFSPEDVVVQVAIDPEKAAHEIIRLASEQFGNFRERPPEKILIGRKEFADLSRSDPALYMLRDSFQFDLKMPRNTLGWGKIPIVVIPWMTGVLVI